MRNARFLLLGLLALIPTFSAASERACDSGDTSTKVVLPPGSELTCRAKPTQHDYFYFDGEIAATGFFLAYWKALYQESEPTTLDKAVPTREMHLRFYPDARTQKLLPEFQSASRPSVRHERLFLYRSRNGDHSSDQLVSAYGESEMALIERIAHTFSELPANFLDHREGFALQPARIVLKDLVSFIEGDHRFLYGVAAEIEPLSITEYGLIQIPDSEPDIFLGTPWIETFYAPNPLIVRRLAEQGSPIVAELPAGTSSIEKVHTVDEQWVLIRVKTDKNQVVEGYVQAHDLMIVN